ncbi:acyl-CoA dehydrogenase family protein [Rhodococcus sp. T7]|uniref:acyl-CoA dehydrogenase family protein n=1 Tax=Rhodococcus sp. T7 TaxID=627444 RepID=UPI00135A4485|nr:acyl-CoA dehydrogenase family protein [Rhodococcus sp. T7]KAF0959969.1 Acyl-CoA dehydrogenase FadE27 [Rhodococcus sp. T7]
MDFTFGEEQEAVRGLAADVFAAKSRPERIKEVESTADRVDRELWRELATTGLLGIALPENLGGGGAGLAELYVLLEEQGRNVAPVPLWPHVLGALAIAEFGTPAQRDALVPAAVDGSGILTVALEEFGPHAPSEPSTTAREVDGRWHVHGVKAAVPVAHVAERLVVSAATVSGPALFLVHPESAGVTAQQAESTTHEICANVTFDGAPAEPLGPADGVAVRWLLDRAELAVAALQLGVGEGAVRQAVTYLNGRTQFGRPLATFQAVTHQLADCYIDLEAMRVTLWQAVWLLGSGEDPGTAVPVAKWWATDGGQRVVHRTQHVHGGIGVDTDYPVHRHLLWGKQLAATLGGASSDLARLGALLAAGVEVVA